MTNGDGTHAVDGVRDYGRFHQGISVQSSLRENNQPFFGKNVRMYAAYRGTCSSITLRLALIGNK